MCGEPGSELRACAVTYCDWILSSLILPAQKPEEAPF
jgi:hypothetical protein